jgi:hypothetical protein
MADHHSYENYKKNEKSSNSNASKKIVSAVPKIR